MAPSAATQGTAFNLVKYASHGFGHGRAGIFAMFTILSLKAGGYRSARPHRTPADQQVDEACQGQRQAESQAATIQQQRAQLQGELAKLRMQFSLQGRELKRCRTELDAAAENATRWAERQTLTTQFALSRGRMEGIESAMRSLQARTVAAETRVAEALTRRGARNDRW
jgi:chromosome segregation ATPase